MFAAGPARLLPAAARDVIRDRRSAAARLVAFGRQALCGLYGHANDVARRTGANVASVLAVRGRNHWLDDALTEPFAEGHTNATALGGAQHRARERGYAMTSNHIDRLPVESRWLHSRGHLIGAYLTGARQELHALLTPDSQDARTLLAAASRYATATLAESNVVAVYCATFITSHDVRPRQRPCAGSVPPPLAHRNLAIARVAVRSDH